MTMEAHLAELERRHRSMEEQIKTANMSPSTDSLEVAELKRKKLQLKDEIVKLKKKASWPVFH
jgi:hypothetical protein